VPSPVTTTSTPATAPRRPWSIPDLADPTQLREVRLLFGVARPLAVIYLLSAPVFLVPGITLDAGRWPSVLILAGSGAAFALALAMARRGKVVLAGWIVIATSLVSEMASTTAIGGIRSVLAGSLLLGVLTAGILRGWRAAVGTAGIATAYVLLEGALEHAGVAPLFLPAITPGSALLTAVAMLAIAAALLTLYAHELGRASAALRASDARAVASERALADLVRHSPDGIAVVGLDGRLRSVNEALCRMSDFTAADFVGCHVLELPVLPEKEEVRATVLDGLKRTLSGALHSMEVELRRRDGSPFWVETRGKLVAHEESPTAFQVTIREVSARVEAERTRLRLEAELRDARRMESIGRLAGGVAHDFRNLLTPILLNAGLVREDAGLPPGEVRALVGEIEEAARRANELTGQLLAFARRQILQVGVLDLNAVVGGLEPMLRRVIREDVALRLALQAGLPPVKADRAQLEQVIVNLVANARDAMPGGGALTVSTSVTTLDQARAASHPGARPGTHVVLAVRDTGVGMSEEVRARIFDPFFTTKASGRGTGLGLATVDGVVSQSGGFVAVESAPGRGSTFLVHLPAAAGAPPVEAARPRRETRLPAGTVALVVDDEPAVRSVVARVLRGRGLEVIDAGHGDEALVEAGRLPRLDILVTDVVMPGMAGRELAGAVRRLHPRAGVLFLSGYADEGIVEGGVLDATVSFLAKPFTPDMLVDKVLEVLAPG
jgi:two-component system cell cycle sensor histidine kinase/response regulator CckA